MILNISQPRAAAVGESLFLLTKLSQKRTQEAIVWIQLAAQTPKKVEALAVGLNDVLGPQGARFTDHRRSAPGFGELGEIDHEVLPALWLRGCGRNRDHRFVE